MSVSVCVCVCKKEGKDKMWKRERECKSSVEERKRGEKLFIYEGNNTSIAYAEHVALFLWKAE